MEFKQVIFDNDFVRFQELLSSGNDPNSVNPEDGCTSLHYASISQNIEFLSFLLQIGTLNVNSGNLEGNTPLHVAVAVSNFSAVKSLLQFGANPFMKNNKDKLPIDYSRTAQIRSLIASRMVTSTDSVNTVSDEDVENFKKLLPNNYDDLLVYCIDMYVQHMTFEDRVKEALLRLIEDKHVALHKTRLMEQAVGITDPEQSETFLNQPSYLQEENEKMSAELNLAKNNIAYLRKLDDSNQRSMQTFIEEHNNQLKSFLDRIEEMERNFGDREKKYIKEISEMQKLKYDNEALRTKINLAGQVQEQNQSEAQIETLKTENVTLSAKIQELTSEKTILEERLKSYEQIKLFKENENPQARLSLHDEIADLDEDRRKQDETDEQSGQLVFIKTEGLGPKQIKGGTREKLVERLTDGGSYDSQFLQAFLLTFRAFMSPEMLLDMIVTRYMEANSTDKSVSQAIRLRVCNTIKYWLDNYWNDFLESPSLLDKTSEFVNKSMTQDSPKLAEQLSKLIERKRRGSDVVTVSRKAIPPKSIVPKPTLRKGSVMDIKGNETLSRDIRASSMLAFDKVYNMMVPGKSSIDEGSVLKFVDFDPLELARQITLYEYELFRSIQPTEFLDQAWLKDDKLNTAPGICEMTSWSTRVTKWVISEIVSIQDSVKSRALLCEKFVQLAQNLEKMNNFNGVMEVLAAFQSSSVHRLKKTSQAMSSRYLKILEELTKITSRELNYKNLRARVHAANPPLIPFPGVYLGDLVFLDSGNPMYLDGNKNLINFQKFQKLASYILELQVYQQTQYQYAPILAIQDYIKSLQPIEDEAAYNLSLICEPRMAPTLTRGATVFNK